MGKTVHSFLLMILLLVCLTSAESFLGLEEFLDQRYPSMTSTSNNKPLLPPADDNLLQGWTWSLSRREVIPFVYSIGGGGSIQGNKWRENQVDGSISWGDTTSSNETTILDMGIVLDLDFYRRKVEFLRGDTQRDWILQSYYRRQQQGRVLEDGITSADQTTMDHILSLFQQILQWVPVQNDIEYQQLQTLSLCMPRPVKEDHHLQWLLPGEKDPCRVLSAFMITTNDNNPVFYHPILHRVYVSHPFLRYAEYLLSGGVNARVIFHAVIGTILGHEVFHSIDQKTLELTRRMDSPSTMAMAMAMDVFTWEIYRNRIQRECKHRHQYLVVKDEDLADCMGYITAYKICRRKYNLGCTLSSFQSHYEQFWRSSASYTIHSDNDNIHSSSLQRLNLAQLWSQLILDS